MKMTVTTGGDPVPVGGYEAAFAGLEQTEHPEVGPGVAWRFRILTGDQRDRIATRVTGESPSLKNAAGRLLSAITGAALAAGQEVDLQEFVGREFMISVEPSPSGQGTRVGAVIAAKK